MSQTPGKYDQAWNFGPLNNEVKTVNEVVDIFYKANNIKGEYKLNTDNKVHEAGILKLDISKSTTKLNWTPILETKFAIELTANWYKKYMEGATASELVNNDIKYFIK
jgi:CDP-glucose 4,6-dehydratase